MITVKLYGKLKQLCGGLKVHTFNNCYSLKQLLSALRLNYIAFDKYINSNPKDSIYLMVNKQFLNYKDLSKWALFNTDIVKIVPVLKGAGEDGNTIIGVVLIIIAVVLIIYTQGVYGWELFEVGGEYLVVAESTFYVAAAAFAYAGISLLMTNNLVQAPNSYEGLLSNSKANDSYGFQGTPSNLTSQGNPVPLGYGRMRVGSQVISTGIFAQNI